MAGLPLSQVRVGNTLWTRVAGRNLTQATVWSEHKESVEDPQIPLFAQSLGSWFMVRTYDLGQVSSDEEEVQGLVDQTIRDVNEYFGGLIPCVAYINGASLVLVYATDEFGELRRWTADGPDLGPFSIRPDAKTMKRLSIFGWSEHLAKEFDRDLEFEPVSLQANDLYDGVSFIRTSVFLELVGDSDEARNIVFDDQGRIKQRRYHMRVVTQKYGLIKGDFILIDDLPVDIVTDRNNVCDELWSNDGRTRAMAFAQYQCKPALSNVQLLNYFYGIFWNQEDLVQSLRVDVSYHLKRVANGDAPEHVMETLGEFDDGTDEVDVTSDRQTVISNTAPIIRNLNKSFEQADVPKNISARLVQYAAHGSHMTLQKEVASGIDPSSGQSSEVQQYQRIKNARRFTLPFAFMVSLTSDSAARTAGVDADLSPGEVHVDYHIGMLVHDEDYPRVAEILGGGDQDDKVILALVREKNTHEIWIAAIRNPIGNQSNGAEYGVEYELLKPTDALYGMLVQREKQRYENSGVGDQFSEELIPEFDFADLPQKATDVELSGNEVDFGVRDVPESYSYGHYVRPKAEVAAKAARVYGTHCLLSMAAYNVDVALSPVGAEGDIIDACTQYYVKDTVDALEHKNKQHFQELKGYTFDAMLHVRLPYRMFSDIKNYGLDREGVMYQLMRAYETVLDNEFKPQVREIINDTVDRGRELVQNYEDPQVPLLFDFIWTQQQEKRQQVKRGLSGAEFAQVADAVVNTFVEVYGEDRLRREIFEFLSHFLRISQPDFGRSFTSCVRTNASLPRRSDKRWPRTSPRNISGGDTLILNGALADYTIQVYQALVEGSGDVV